MHAHSSKIAVEPVSSTVPSSLRTPSARSIGPGGGRHSAPAARSGLFGRAEALRRSVWFPVAARTAAIVAGMIALAAIGTRSTLSGAGVPVVVSSAHAVPSASGVWMPPGPPAPTSPPSATSNGSPEPAPPRSPGITADGRVILNVASADELSKLPRVGAKRAEAIIVLRQKLGKFKRPTDLLRVRGIGQKTLKLMLPRLVVDPPAGS